MRRVTRGKGVVLGVLGGVALLAALALSTTASAIVGGAPDTTHGFVGAAIQPQVQNGQQGMQLCSGFMISATHFVTAAHCFDPNGAPILVTFDQGLVPPPVGSFVPAVVTATHDDVAVLTLLVGSQPAWAALPAPGASASASAVDVVGYGVEGFDPHKSPTAFGMRKIVTTPVKSAGKLADQFLKLLAGPGACFGDSGGPNFVSGTSTVVAITSGGSKNCNGVSYAERIDTPDMLAFLASFTTS